MRLRPSAIAVFLTLLIQGCGGGGSSSDASSSSGNNTQDSSTQNSSNGTDGVDNQLQQSEFNTPAELIGTWILSFCEEQSGVFARPSLEIAEGSIVISGEFFQDPDCSSPLALFTSVTSTTLFDGTTTSTSLGEAYNFRRNVVSATAGAQEIDPAQLDILLEEFDIILTDGQLLYFGDDVDPLDGTTAALRPVTLDLREVYLRQQ